MTGPGTTSGRGGPRSGARERLSPKAAEYAHELLSALFMAVRTARIHDPSNAAFEAAVQRVHQCAVHLHAATAGFDVQFVGESVFLNGVPLRFEAGAFVSMRTLRGILEERGLGGFRMRTPPTYQEVHRLLSLFAARTRRCTGSCPCSPRAGATRRRSAGGRSSSRPTSASSARAS
jgi:hypothetical protein